MSFALRKLNRGTELTIFQDPLTRQRAEGRAKLVRFLRADDATLEGRLCHIEDWMVEFVEEPGVRYERTIAWV